MGTSRFSYMLRYAVEPGHMEQERLKSLVSFCQNAQIDDVMFFINGEELNSGHQTEDELLPWLDVIIRGKSMLEPLGISTSINPWTTFLHMDRGRTLRSGQSFRLMVDPRGKSSSAVVCPLCPEWRKYIKRMYAAYAALEPNVLWLEDDFRFHNHAPLEWGGCFCDVHLQQFSKLAGVKQMTRESFISGVLRPGNPHPYRQIWLDTCRETLIEIANEIREVVHSISPATRLGLMTSDPQIHAAEGRNWRRLFSALAGDRQAVIRPHLPSYAEVPGIVYWRGFNQISRTTAALVPDQVMICPELENFTYTLFNKSIAFQQFQLETSLLVGATGITMNIFDMMGNGVYHEERHDKCLQESKAFLNQISGLNLSVHEQTGIEIPVCENASGTLHTSSGTNMSELYPDETFWAALFSAFGVANKISPCLSEKTAAVAISGQYFRNMSESEIRDLFASRLVFLNGDAVHTLYCMGMGSLCGIRNVEWHSADSGFQAYEQVSDGNTYFGIELARMTAQASVGNLLAIEYDLPVHQFTAIHRYDGQVACPGMVLVQDRVFIMPYGQKGEHKALLHPVRQEIIQQVLQKLKTGRPLMICNYVPHVSVFEYRREDQQCIVIVNTSLDRVKEIDFSRSSISVGGWVLYTREHPAGQPVELNLRGNYIRFEGEIEPLTMVVLCKKINTNCQVE